MIELLDYDFFRLALCGVAIISVAAAVIGVYIITRRMAAIAGGLTHACFGGLGLGYWLGVNPVLMAGVFAVLSSLGVEWLSGRMRLRSDSAIAVIWGVGMAVGVLFVFMTEGYVPELNSFLFGSILTVSVGDLVAFGVYTVVLLAVFGLWYKEIVACAFDRDFARVAGLRTGLVTMVMTVMTALCIVLTIRLVGVMLLMSLLSLPVMIAETFTHRVKTMMAASAAISVVCSVVGLFVGAGMDVPPSALIVLVMAGVFFVVRGVSIVVSRRALRCLSKG